MALGAPRQARIPEDPHLLQALELELPGPRSGLETCLRSSRGVILSARADSESVSGKGCSFDGGSE
eukprot:6004825-Alexandrium_andersonii.AAC.1